MLQKVTIVLAIALMLLTTIVTASDAEQATKTRQGRQPEPRFSMNELPPAGNSIATNLEYLEAVIHALELELPTKSMFRSLYAKRAHLGIGYDKDVKFSYVDLLKNLPGQEY